MPLPLVTIPESCSSLRFLSGNNVSELKTSTFSNSHDLKKPLSEKEFMEKLKRKEKYDLP